MAEAPEPYLITGIEGDTFQRLEIRELEKDPKQFTLFILAWQKVCYADDTPKAVQFVQQAGIHGLPHEPWVGDPDGKLTQDASTKEDDPDYPWKGYCNHGSVLFPTWHRPSIMLLEQSIWEAAQGLANDFAEKYPEEGEPWKEAAKGLRFPFWDWTDPSTGTEGLPKILCEPEIFLTLPGGEIVPHDNPIAFYKFGASLPNGFVERHVKNRIIDPEDPNVQYQIFFNKWDRTYRWAKYDEHDPIPSGEDIEEINRRLKGHGPGEAGSWKQLTTQVANLFIFPQNVPKDEWANIWDQFSNTSFQSNPNKERDPQRPSIEDPHNTLHLLLGGRGHMMHPDYASFDPIFYLHHCNIDRILAFWEHIYPDYYMGEDGYLASDGNRKPFTETDGKWGVDPNTVVKGSSSLTPFRKGDGRYWTSDSVRWAGKASEPKYYTYPPIKDPNDPNNPDRYIVIGKETTPEEREWQRGALQQHFRWNPVKLVKDARDKVGLIPPFSEFDLPAEHGYTKVKNYQHFVIVVELDPYVLNMSYSVDILYDSGEDDLRFIGRAAAFSRGKDTQCGACNKRREAGVKSRHVLIIPHVDVVRILAQPSGESEQKSAQAILKSLRAQINLPDGTTLARTSLGDEVRGISDALIPKITFHSSSIQYRTVKGLTEGEIPPTPYETYGWNDHGNLPGRWVRA